MSWLIGPVGHMLGSIDATYFTLKKIVDGGWSALLPALIAGGLAVLTIAALLAGFFFQIREGNPSLINFPIRFLLSVSIAIILGGVIAWLIRGMLLFLLSTFTITLGLAAYFSTVIAIIDFTFKVYEKLKKSSKQVDEGTPSSGKK